MSNLRMMGGKLWIAVDQIIAEIENVEDECRSRKDHSEEWIDGSIAICHFVAGNLRAEKRACEKKAQDASDRSIRST